MIEVVLLYLCSEFTILALRKPEADVSYVEEYLDGLDERQRKKLVRAMVRLGDHGPHPSPQKHKPLGDWQLCELKAKQDRILWFYGRDHDGHATVVMASAFTKKSNKTPRSELERAADRRKLYFATYGETDEH